MEERLNPTEIIDAAARDVEEQFHVTVEDASKRALLRWANVNSNKVSRAISQGRSIEDLKNAARIVLSAAAESVIRGQRPPFTRFTVTEVATRRAISPENCPYFC